LIRIFNYLGRKERSEPELSLKGLLKKIFRYCWYNTHDFMVAGYSSDLCLCDLNRVPDIEGPVCDLSAQLIKGLRSKDERAQKLVRECILLAHLDAQSYFNENYHDLYDFCFRLQQRFKSANQKPIPTEVQAIKKACQKILKVLEKGVTGDKDEDKRLIVRSDFVGPTYQYSHGLSVYFPWSKPIKRKFWPDEYNKYRFISRAPADDKKTWSDFLDTYFEMTRRLTRVEEFTQVKAPGCEDEIKQLSLPEVLLEAFAIGVVNSNGQLGGPDDPGKPGPDSSVGAGCDCQSIKNYPLFTRKPQSEITGGGKIPVNPPLAQDEEGSTYTYDGLQESLSLN
jgi:hypothetical protein